MADKRVEFVIVRNGESHRMTVEPATDPGWPRFDRDLPLAVASKVRYPNSLGEAVSGGVTQLVGPFLQNPFRPRTLGGPLSVVTVASRLEQSHFVRRMAGFLFVTAYLSFLLAVYNLLPVPFLDGWTAVKTVLLHGRRWKCPGCHTVSLASSNPGVTCMNCGYVTARWPYLIVGLAILSAINLFVAITDLQRIFWL